MLVLRATALSMLRPVGVGVKVYRLQEPIHSDQNRGVTHLRFWETTIEVRYPELEVSSGDSCGCNLPLPVRCMACRLDTLSLWLCK